MSLIVYECQRAEHGHEIRQFGEVARQLHAYYEGRPELAVLIGNVNIGHINLDGLIIKEDAIVILELKDRSGAIVARQNGDWTCDSNPIKGGSGGKTVFDQLSANRRQLRTALIGTNVFSSLQVHDIQGLVVFSALKSLTNNLDRENRQWVHIADVGTVGKAMHGIRSRAYYDRAKDDYVQPEFDERRIFKFIRSYKIEESALVTDVSDTNRLPADLFHKDAPHNGKLRTLEVELVEKDKELAAKDRALEVKAEEAEGYKKRLEEMEAIRAMLENLQRKQDELQARQEGRGRLGEAEVVVAGAAVLTRIRKVHVQKDWDVGDELMDDDQLDLIEKTLDKSMLVAGCAGSGKSVIAMKKAVQIKGAGGDVILIAFTKALNRFMSCGKGGRALGRRFYHYYEWVKDGKPRADYVIVDEIQDFTEKEIREFISAAKKGYFFFGDTAQSIYRSFGKDTLSIEQIGQLTGLKPLRLYNNYRLPRGIAKITQPYVAIGANVYSERIYQSKERTVPYFLQMVNKGSQVDFMVNRIREMGLKDVGILLPTNEDVVKIYEGFTDASPCCEYKYTPSGKMGDWHDTLDFGTDLPKIMTYHSAKGLQFETVFLPFYDGAVREEERKALYVAMTRTWRNLYVLYSGELKSPLKEVPVDLYLKKV